MGSDADKPIFILDGYNVIHKIPRLEAQLDQSLADAREGLFRLCRDWMNHRRDVWRFYIVFDGDSSVVGSREGGGFGIVALYSQSGQTADDMILRVLEERRHDRRCVVISEDNEVVRRSRLLGAEVRSVREFVEVLDRSRRRGGIERAQSDGKNQLTAAEERSINEELKRLWGID